MDVHPADRRARDTPRSPRPTPAASNILTFTATLSTHGGLDPHRRALEGRLEPDHQGQLRQHARLLADQAGQGRGRLLTRARRPPTSRRDFLDIEQDATALYTSPSRRGRSTSTSWARRHRGTAFPGFAEHRRDLGGRRPLQHLLGPGAGRVLRPRVQSRARQSSSRALEVSPSTRGAAPGGDGRRAGARRRRLLQRRARRPRGRPRRARSSPAPTTSRRSAINPAGLAEIDGTDRSRSATSSRTTATTTRARRRWTTGRRDNRAARRSRSPRSATERPGRPRTPLHRRGLRPRPARLGASRSPPSRRPGSAASSFPLDGGQRYMMVSREAIILNYAASAAWRFRDCFGVGVTLEWISVPRLDYSLVINANAGPRAPPTRCRASTTSWRTTTGSDPFTFNAIVGAWFRPRPSLELGLAGQVVPASIVTHSTLSVTPLDPASWATCTLTRNGVPAERRDRDAAAAAAGARRAAATGTWRRARALRRRAGRRVRDLVARRSASPSTRNGLESPPLRRPASVTIGDDHRDRQAVARHAAASSWAATSTLVPDRWTLRAGVYYETAVAAAGLRQRRLPGRPAARRQRWARRCCSRRWEVAARLPAALSSRASPSRRRTPASTSRSRAAPARRPTPTRHLQRELPRAAGAGRQRRQLQPPPRTSCPSAVIYRYGSDERRRRHVTQPQARDRLAVRPSALAAVLLAPRRGMAAAAPSPRSTPPSWRRVPTRRCTCCCRRRSSRSTSPTSTSGSTSRRRRASPSWRADKPYSDALDAAAGAGGHRRRRAPSCRCSSCATSRSTAGSASCATTSSRRARRASSRREIEQKVSDGTPAVVRAARRIAATRRATG